MSNPTLRKIGNTSVPPIGLGVMGLSPVYGAIGSDEDRFKVLDVAHEQGCLHWDTSDVYGDTEELLGKWFKRTGKRNDIFLATKFGYTPSGIRGDREHVREAIDASLKKLAVDSVDLFYAHRVDPKVPIEVTVSSMAELVKEGKVRYLGLSECSAKELRRAHTVHPIAALQVEVSPFALEVFDPKLALLETARELGVTIVAYSPLGRGLLTGRYASLDDLDADDVRRKAFPKFSAENFPKIVDLVSRIKEVGARHQATAGQVALAWILARGADFVAIPGTKQIKYIEENIGAVALKLTTEEVATITKLAENADITGERYIQQYLDDIFVETPPMPVS